MTYDCCDPQRRSAVDAHPTLNGIDHLEVLDADAPKPDVPRQQTLLLRLLKPLPAGLGRDNLVLRGGERIRGIGIEWAEPADAPSLVEPAAVPLLAALPDPDHVLVVRTDQAGDFSTYVLSLVRGPEDTRPPAGIDPRLAAVEFSFKVECPSDFDCRPDCGCAEAGEQPPDIDYLARDYPSLRRLVLDRMQQQVPGWRARTAADLGVTIAELLAYVADQLSYTQDAIATEAYLDTARLRTSLRRHALLVDYRIHEGTNARAWVQVRVTGGPVPLAAADVRFLTRVTGLPDRIVPDSAEEATAAVRGAEVFEALHDVTLHESANDLSFHTWGEEECCLPVGATHATLRGHHPELEPGMALVLAEVIGPRTGEAADADPAHRHPVRLTAVQAFGDGAAALVDPLTEEEVTQVWWHDADGLPFPLCVSARTDEDHGDQHVPDVAVAWGNVVLVDHGATLDPPEPLGSVPDPVLHRPPSAGPCDRSAPEPVPPRFAPLLGSGPLTRQGTVGRTRLVQGRRVVDRVLVDLTRPAAEATGCAPAEAVPALVVEGVDGTGAATRWTPQPDLLDSLPADAHLVVEAEHDGTVRLRFGDDVHGRRPDVGTAFAATYRVGNGTAGNVGAGAIAHLVSSDGRLDRASNPLPAMGGTEPESPAAIRRNAPEAFRIQQRAVTPADYEEVTTRHPGIQQAAARLRWTGSWHTVQVTVDRQGGEPLDGASSTALLDHLDSFRMAGHDLQLRDPVHVSLELDLLVCVAENHLRSDVRQGLRRELGSGVLPDGRRGLFHPDNLTFGQPVHLSAVYAAALRVAGVATVEVTRFHRQGQPDDGSRDAGVLRVAPTEIARLADDPSFPEHGVLRLDLRGGR